MFLFFIAETLRSCGAHFKPSQERGDRRCGNCGCAERRLALSPLSWGLRTGPCQASRLGSRSAGSCGTLPVSRPPSISNRRTFGET